MSTTGWKIKSSSSGVTLESKTIASDQSANLTLSGDTITLNSTSGTVVNGNLVVNGTTTTIDTENVAVNDPLISLARNNEANTLDIGFYGKYVSDGDRYTGMFYDASDSKFKLFKGLSVEPTTTVNSSHESFTKASLVANIEGSVSSISNFTTDDLVEGNSNVYYTDSRARSAISATGNAVSYDNTSGVITVNLANTALPMFSAFKQNYSSSGSATDLVRFNSEDVTIDTIGGWSLVTHLYTANQEGKYRISFSFTPGEFSPDISLILYKDGVETTRKVTNYVSGGNVRGTVAMDIIEQLISGTSLGVRITIDRVSFPTSEVILENVSFVVQMLPENYFFPTSGVSESPVVSVNGQSGVVLLNTSNIPEGSQAYFTDQRARSALSAGDGILYDNTTGVITSLSSSWLKTGNDLYYTDGRVGIGTAVPEGNLHVVGTIIQNDIAIGHGSATVTEPIGSLIDSTKQFNFVEGAQSGPGGRGIWATKMFGNVSSTNPILRQGSVATDLSGNVYVAGFFQGDPWTIFNSDGTPSGITLSQSGVVGAFIVKYNSSGVAQWATKIDGSGDDYASNLAVDASGNVYVTGSYTNTVTVYSTGDVIFETLDNAGSYAAFVVKYNTLGVAQWVTRIDGSSKDEGMDIAVDNNESVYVIGYFFSSATIYSTGNVSFGTLSSSGFGGEMGFLVKYNTLGVAQWMTKVEPYDDIRGCSVATGSDGSVYAAYNGMSFGRNVPRFLIYNSDGSQFAQQFIARQSRLTCIVKYNSFGLVQWATFIPTYVANSQGTESGFIQSVSIKADSSGSLVASMRHIDAMGTVVYNSDGKVFKIIAGGNGGDSPSNLYHINILLKYDSNGFCQWVTHTSGVSSLFSNHNIAIDSSDNIYKIFTTYNTDNSIISSNGSLFGNLSEFINIDSSNVAIVKYTPDGSVRWVTGLSSNDTMLAGSGLAVGSDQNVYVAGFASLNVNISNSDKSLLETLSITGSGAYLVKYTSEGGVFKPYDLLPLSDLPENQGRTLTLVNKVKTPADIFLKNSSSAVLDIMQIRSPLRFVFYGGKWYSY